MLTMKKVYIIGTIFSVFLIGDKPLDQFPEAEISNGLIKARLYLPDTKDGYYRASRFDWSGVMPELEYMGHSYFGQWFEKYSPTIHDAIMGPVEDFLPVGYDEAKTGGSFLKIGIGIVIKPEESKYSIVTPYQLINPGTWKVKKKSDQVEFIHELNDKEYAYEYKKTIQLIKGKPEMVLSHSLKNTGKQAIETNVYDHNFFVMDKQNTGQSFVVTFPFNLTGEADGTGDFGKIQDNKIIFQKELSKNEHLFYKSLQGFGNSAKDYDIKIENHKTGAAIRITSDQPLSKLVFWSAPKTLCPEPFIQIKIRPGEIFKWKIYYQFYICDIIN
jgi:hypothetical protein